MKMGTKLLITAAAIPLVAGCVSLREFNDYKQRVDKLDSTANVNTADIRQLKNQMNAILDKQANQADVLKALGYQVTDLRGRFEASEKYLKLRLESISSKYGYSPDISLAAVREMVDSVSAFALKEYQRRTPNHIPIPDRVLVDAIQVNLVAALTNPDASGRDSILIKSKSFGPSDVQLLLDVLVSVKNYIGRKYHIKREDIHVMYTKINGYDERGKQVKKGRKGELGVKCVFDAPQLLEGAIDAYAHGQVPQDMKNLWELEKSAQDSDAGGNEHGAKGK